MKKYIIFLSAILGIAQAQKVKTPGFRIEGHIAGLGEKSRVTLTDANKPTDTLARASVKEGIFVLTGQVNEPNLYVLNFAGSQKKTTLFIGNETVVINGNVDNLAGIQVKGSPSEADFLFFEKMFNPYFAQLNQLSQQANAPEFSAKRDSIG